SCFSAPQREDAAAKSAGTDLDAGADAASIVAYKKYVVAQAVTLENNDLALVFSPDMAFTLLDKKTGTTRAGETILFTGVTRKPNTFDREILKVHLDSGKTGRIILRLLECTEQMVKYRYEEPAEMAGRELVLRLTKE
ncbi:MAG: hypothetical protein LBT68_05685, partial [Spirochaetales bacterium]|nr:hypothetical protein [Spirochaetales bacterium]